MRRRQTSFLLLLGGRMHDVEKLESLGEFLFRTALVPRHAHRRDGSLVDDLASHVLFDRVLRLDGLGFGDAHQIVEHHRVERGRQAVEPNFGRLKRPQPRRVSRRRRTYSIMFSTPGVADRAQSVNIPRDRRCRRL